MENIFFGLTHVFQWSNLLIMALGVAIGIIIGAIPGLGPVIGIALLLPITFGMDPATGILLLIGIYCGGIYGGSVTAILIKTPGTAASAASVADGFALAQQGKASTALNMSIYASVAGGLISGVVLLFLAQQVAAFALNFGPPEYFMLAVFGLTIISGVSGKYLSKGLAMGCLGILIATVGMDEITGTVRFTFGTNFLLSGIDLVPMVIGLFAISEVFRQVSTGIKSISSNTTFKTEKFGWRNLLQHKVTVLKSSIIGVIIGIIPGPGGAIASFTAYSEARRTSKNPDSYGKGSLNGLAATESANNGTTGTTLIPMLTFGIPGDAVTAVLLGSLIIHGLTPGPQLFTNHGGTIYTILIGFIVINIIMFFQAKLAIRWIAKVTMIRSSILLPIVLALCLIGAYAVDNSLASVGIALFFGVIGYFLLKYEYPITPILIGLILGPMIEKSLLQSLTISNGSLMIFLQRPISIVFLLLAIFSIIFTDRRNMQNRKHSNTISM